MEWPHSSQLVARSQPEPSESEVSHDISQHGLNTVAEGVDPVLDIVAVHGLDGHPKKSWTAANGVHWLRDLLPSTIPNARIFCWGYDSRTHGDARLSCQHLYEHAESLVSELCLYRKIDYTTKRPIIFVGHCLGGIVIKSALIHSDRARRNEHRSILLSTHGILFLGTPHQGANGVQLAKVMANVASVFAKTDDRLLKHLERDSEWLQLQLSQYSQISEEFVTKFLYEEYKTPTAFGHSIMVVPRASAVVPGAADAEAIVIHADHINMAKFASKYEIGYKTISGHLQLMARDAGERITARWGKEEKDNSASANVQPFAIPLSLSELRETEAFVAREEELVQIDETLRNRDGRQTVTLHGLGGIGKTQLAGAYAVRYGAKYSAVFWLNIKDEASIKQSFARAATRIADHIPSSGLGVIKEAGDQDKIVSAVIRWLDQSNNKRWLLLYDNYDNPKVAGNTDCNAVDIQRFLPTTYHGSVLITTRSSSVEIGRQISVRKLTKLEDSLQILSNTSKREFTIQDPDAVKLAKELDGLPLALATAGAYLKLVSTSLVDYLHMYEASWSCLLQNTPDLNSYDGKLYTTWQLSFKHIKDQNKLSAKLLELWAYFDNGDLWFELLQSGRADAPEWLRQLTKDQMTFTETVRPLLTHGLVEANAFKSLGTESVGYNMHSCVHSWTTHALNYLWQEELAAVSLKCVSSHVQGSSISTISMLSRTLQTHLRRFPHAIRCHNFVLKGGVNMNDRKWALQGIGVIYASLGRFDEAVQIYEELMEGYTTASEDDPSGLDRLESSLISMIEGVSLSCEDELKAQKLCDRVLSSFDQFPSRDTPMVHDMMCNLARIRRKQGRARDAQKMYEAALHGQEKILGPGHVRTLHIMREFGDFYAEEDRANDAEEMYQRALQGYEKLPDSAFETHETLVGLGNAYLRQSELNDAEKASKLDEAEKAYKRALQISEKVSESTDMSSDAATGGLGDVYKEQGKLDKAEQSYKKIIGGLPVTISNMIPIRIAAVSLGKVYEMQGRLDKAEKLFEEVLPMLEGSPWPDEKLWLVISLGSIYMEREGEHQAVHIYEKTLQEYGEEALHGFSEKVLQRCRRRLDAIATLLSSIYIKQRQCAKAEKICSRALQNVDKMPDELRLFFLEITRNLAYTYAELEKLDEAEQIIEQAWPGLEMALGSGSPPALQILQNFGSIYVLQGNSEKAEQIYHRALEGYEKVFDQVQFRSDEGVCCLLHHFVALYALTNRWGKAQEMFARAIECCEVVYGRPHEHYISLTNFLSCVDRKLGHTQNDDQGGGRIVVEVEEEDVKEDDVKENDVKEDDVKEDDVKENDVKEDDVKEDDVKEDGVKDGRWRPKTKRLVTLLRNTRFHQYTAASSTT